MGDHGTFTSRIWKKQGNYEYYNTSHQDYILDLFNVLLAIKWPKNIKFNDNNMHFSPEIFQRIFNSLDINANIASPSLIMYDFNQTAHSINFTKKD